ncbi:DUF6282 family protein [Homoserinibacter sp. YIM 151385]|uniref:DUF6282 family protein n=1 Tax=Homoserinibacter sp. YIM 151385 TaxID=2985506 RepID=UPI0022F030FE|nr:DUF6282 family protein [Homoserinibacter sp. YIM 151385]WBU37084.1 DUF6282 family protein [Homoserinibacter sp. YIM 151385]
MDDELTTPLAFADALPPDYGRFLRGAFDLHAHGQPDLSATALNRGPDVGVARLASAYGMRGWVLKSHLWPTMDRAAIVQRELGDLPFEVLGSITLNPQLGGVDPAVVELAADAGAEVVFLPTWGARADVERWGYISRLLERQSPRFRGFAEANAVSLLDAGGGLRSEVAEAIEVCAQRGLLLGTGHVSLEESLAVVRECRRLDVPVMLTHPLHFTDDPAELHVFTELGAKVEFSSAPLINPESHHGVRDFAAAIRELGPEHVVLSSDVFSRWVPPLPESLRTLAEQLFYLGLTPEELRRMLVVNPHELLRRPVPELEAAA